WDMAFDSIKDSIRHLPDRLAEGAKKIGDLAGDAARGVGEIANKAGKGLFEGFGTPLLIGAGLIGLFLISRARPDAGHEEECAVPRKLPWTIGGGAALGAYLLLRRPQSAEAAAISAAGPLPGRWVWPVPMWRGRRPVISSGFNSPRPGLDRHGGVDVMYARSSSDPFKAGTPNGSAGYVMPDDMVALAASDGAIWSAGSTPKGFEVVIDHAPSPWTTYYAHLDKLFVSTRSPGAGGPRVRAGQPLGIIGFSPLDKERLKHLHFELWRGAPKDRVDPEAVMSSWETVGDPRDAAVARNANLVYRAIGASGDPYPDWVRALRDRAGVYVIREVETREIVYVGSSTGQLYATMTRHFQAWRRLKGFWK